jgi:hypothetical protein
VVKLANILGVLLLTSSMAAVPQDHKPSELVGTWRGTSTCSDLAAAPGCRDELVVYDFTAGPKAGTMTWKADKVVDGKRVPMGEMELTYDVGQNCWSAEFQSARVHSSWCLVVDGSHLTGTGRLLPGQETIRKIDVRKDAGAGGRR